MNDISPQIKNQETQPARNLHRLFCTHGIEVENFITDKRGDILEDGKELVAVWDQMFNGALNFLKSLTSSSVNVPEYIRKKIKSVSRKDVDRHGKIIRYVQMEYELNGKFIAINILGPDPNISQITWLLELVTPPCQFLEELDWWINTLYIAAATSITKGYNIQPLGFNPFQKEYRAGVTCGEHHHIGSFANEKEKKAAYNMIRAYIPHLIAISNTSPFKDGKTTGRVMLKKDEDGRTLILAPDCVRSHRLNENSGQLGPNIPEYLPYVGPSFTREQFSRYVRKEIPDDRYVDAYPFTNYNTIELRFFDSQFDERIRIAIILLIQALAMKGIKFSRSSTTLPEVKGNVLSEHRKRAINFCMFAKFQGDPSIESLGGEFVKYYNHNPETGGPPGKIYESLRALLLWLKPEFQELKITEEDITPLLIMLWGTARIAPPISTATFMLYLYEQNHENIAYVINNLSLLNGRPRKTFCEVMGRPAFTLESVFSTNMAKPLQTIDSSKTAFARKLQQDSRIRRKEVRAKERSRLRAKQVQTTKILRERLKKERETEKIKLQRLEQLEKAKESVIIPQPSKTIRPLYPESSNANRFSKIKSMVKTPEIIRTPPPSRLLLKEQHSQPLRSVVSREVVRKNHSFSSKKIVVKSALSHKSLPIKPMAIKSGGSYASVATNHNAIRNHITIPKPTITKKTITTSTTKNRTNFIKNVPIVKTTTPSLLETEFYFDKKVLRNASIVNLPNKIDYGNIIPAIKLKWKQSIIRAMISYTLKVEAEIFSLQEARKSQRTAFTETIALEKASLKETCYLPIPIDLNNVVGEFQVKFIVRDDKRNNILLNISKIFSKTKINQPTHQIRKVTIPPNQIGDSSVNLKIDMTHRKTRGRILLWGLSQRGIVKFYDKKAKFKERQLSLDIPILIPLSMCSSFWYILAIFNARGSSSSAYVKTAPPLSKIINVSLAGNPPLKQNVSQDYKSMLTPKLQFKARCEIHAIEILQFDNGKIKSLKKYRLKTRVRKGEQFVLESFDWKAPSLRKGLFRFHKSKSISFLCKIADTVGVINDTLIDIVETPTITIFRR